MELQQVQILGLDEHIENRQRLALMEKEIKKQIDEETTNIKEMLVASGLDTYEAGDFIATLSVRDRSTLDKTELISQGVTTEQIAKATKVSGYIQLDVRARKA